MGVRRFQDLECWQLARKVKLEVYAIIAKSQVAKDFKFCDQVRDSCRSAPRNIAEGFGRFRPLDNARYCEIAKASLMETHNHVIDALDQNYINDNDWENLDRLISRAIGATTNYIVYLKGRGRDY